MRRAVNSGACAMLAGMKRSPRRCGPPRCRRARCGRRGSKHSLETAEDYVEAIAELTETVGEARAVDLARRLGVSHVTVDPHHRPAQARRLHLQPALPRDLPHRQRARGSPEESRDRHDLVVDFLRSLGIPENHRAGRRRRDRASRQRGNAAGLQAAHRPRGRCPAAESVGLDQHFRRRAQCRS